MSNFRPGRVNHDRDPVRYSKDWVVGTITRKLHGCLIVNHDVFIHKSAYVGMYDIKDWFACLQEGDAVEFIAEEHIESKNRWRAISVRDPPCGYRRGHEMGFDVRSPYGLERPHSYPPHPTYEGNMMMVMSAPPPECMVDPYLQHQYYAPPPQPVMMPQPMYLPAAPMYMPAHVPGYYPSHPPPGCQLVAVPPQQEVRAFAPASPPSPYYQPMHAAMVPAAKLNQVATTPAPSETSNTPLDATRDLERGMTPSPTNEQDTASLSSHTEQDTVSLSSHASDSTTAPRESSISEGSAKSLLACLFRDFLGSNNKEELFKQLTELKEQAHSGHDVSSDFLMTVIPMILESPNKEDAPKSKELFLFLFGREVFDQMHFRVAWIVTAYQIAGCAATHAVACDLLAHAIANEYVHMDALRLIVAPLKPSGAALPFVVATLKRVMMSAGEDQLMQLYRSSTFEIADAGDHTENLQSVLASDGLSCLATTTCDDTAGLCKQTAQITISS